MNLRVIKNKNGDLKTYKECKIEYSNFISEVEVKARAFKLGRAKEREETRKLTRDYIDR